MTHLPVTGFESDNLQILDSCALKACQTFSGRTIARISESLQSFNHSGQVQKSCINSLPKFREAKHSPLYSGPFCGDGERGVPPNTPEAPLVGLFFCGMNPLPPFFTTPE